ncbi:unnamed protein product [Adineta ricciae]|uniref:Uncharacterized protein n=1 Tax=Adineta ricciae TaxID=249248 RepID=A0A814RY58_ADIRI|nr:unnamed protein product [Adineta ricciae]
MIDRTLKIKNNLSEQLKLFYDYTKDVQTRVIKPNPLPSPIFRINTDIAPIRKPVPIKLPDIPRLSLNTNPSTSKSVKPSEATAITPIRDLSKLSLSLNNSTKITPKPESSSAIKKTQASISSFSP